MKKITEVTSNSESKSLDEDIIEYDSDSSKEFDESESDGYDKCKFISITLKLDVDIKEESLDLGICSYLQPERANWQSQTVMINYHKNAKGKKTIHAHLAVGYTRGKDRMGKTPIIKIKSLLETMLRNIGYKEIKHDSVKCSFRGDGGLGKLVDYMYKRSLPGYPKFLKSGDGSNTRHMIDSSLKKLCENGNNKWYKSESILNVSKTLVIKDGFIISGGETNFDKICGLVNSWMMKEHIKKDRRSNEFRKYEPSEDDVCISLYAILTKDKLYGKIKGFMGDIFTKSEINNYLNIIYDPKDGYLNSPFYEKNNSKFMVIGEKLYNIYSNEIVKYEIDTEPICIFDRDIPNDEELYVMKKHITGMFVGDNSEERTQLFIEALGSLFKENMKNHPIVLTGRSNSDSFEMIPELLSHIFGINEVPLTKKGIDTTNISSNSPILLIRDAENIFSLDTIRSEILTPEIEDCGKFSKGLINKIPSFVIKNCAFNKVKDIKTDRDYVTFVCSVFDLIGDYNQYKIFLSGKKKWNDKNLTEEGLCNAYHKITLLKPSKMKKLIDELNVTTTYELQHDCIFKHFFPNQVKEYDDYKEMESRVKMFNYRCSISEELKRAIKDDKSGFSLILLYMIVNSCKEKWKNEEKIEKITAAEFCRLDAEMDRKSKKTSSDVFDKTSESIRTELESKARTYLINVHKTKTHKTLSVGTVDNDNTRKYMKEYSRIFKEDGVCVADNYAKSVGLKLDDIVYNPTSLEVSKCAMSIQENDRVISNHLLKLKTYIVERCKKLKVRYSLVKELAVEKIRGNIERVNVLESEFCEKVESGEKITDCEKITDLVEDINTLYNMFIYVGENINQQQNEYEKCLNLIERDKINFKVLEEYKSNVSDYRACVKKAPGVSKYDYMRKSIYDGGASLEQ